MSRVIRVVDGGGSGFRTADVTESVFTNLRESRPQSVQELEEFVATDLLEGTAGISFVVAGLVSANHERLIASPNNPWLKGVDLGPLVSAHTKLRTFVFNDMEGACAGMAALVPEVRGKPFIGMTISSGIGLRFVDKQGLIMFTQTEAGHIRLDHSQFAPLCGCGQRGCFEAVIGGKALRRRVLAETEVREIAIPEGMHPCAFLDQCYELDQNWAIDIYDQFTTGLACFFSTLLLLSGMQLFVFKGSAARAMLASASEEVKFKMKDYLMDPSQADGVEFYFSPTPNGEKNADSFVGGARLFEQLAD